jgi:hypothetical protein
MHSCNSLGKIRLSFTSPEWSWDRTAMNTSRYRQLLASFNEQVSARDVQAGRLTTKWLELFDNLTSSTQARSLLADHLFRVSRSVVAIQILAQERGSVPPFEAQERLWIPQRLIFNPKLTVS